LYYFNATRRAERAPFPLDDAMRDILGADPLDDPFAASPATPAPAKTPAAEPRIEPRIATPSEFDELGVSPVRLRPQDEAAAARLATGRQRRPSRFSYKNAAEDVTQANESRREPQFDSTFDTAIGHPEQSADRFHAAVVPHAVHRETTHSDQGKSMPQSVNESNANRDAKAASPDVIPVYLVARATSGFAGSDLLPLFARMGFEFGEMDVYHFTDGHGQVLFSLMNGVAPGTFNPAKMREQSTPALALFLRLPIARQPNLVLEQFLDLAYHMADALNAVILDDRREELSTESVDRMRALINDD
jgi:cell division protein ZipA